MERFQACLDETAAGGVMVKAGKDTFPAEYRMGPPATDQQIADAEQAMALKLPAALRTFYCRWDGGELLRTVGRWRDEATLWFLRVEQLPEEQQRAVSVYGKRAMRGIVLFTQDGMGGWVGMLPNGQVIDCDHDYPPRTWRQRVITVSLEDFLVQFHQERGIFWFDRWA